MKTRRQKTTPEALSETVVDALGLGCDAKLVIINGWTHTLDLSDRLSVALLHRGIDSVRTVVSDSTFLVQLRSMSRESAERMWSNRAEQIRAADGAIYLSGPRDPSIYGRVSASRIEDVLRSESRIFEAHKKFKKPAIFVGLGSISRERARSYGFQIMDWQNCVNRSIMATGRRMSSVGRALARELDNVTRVHLFTDHGTDFRFSLSKRRALLVDGRITADDMENRSFIERLPSGMVTKIPSPSSASGRVIFDSPVHLMGRNVTGLQWEFVNGRLSRIRDDNGFLSELWSRADGDKDRLSKFSIGINEAAQFGFDMDSLVKGAVTLRIGDNSDLGGAYRSSFSQNATIRHCHVSLDDSTDDIMAKLKRHS